MVIIPQLNEALSYYTITGTLSLYSLYKFLLYGQMDVKINNIK